jgi:two-component system, OmpR family, phosphate regulon sensor histidine kinase PhoR
MDLLSRYVLKNPTPRQVAVLSALIISIGMAAVIQILVIFHMAESEWWFSLLAGVFTFLIAYRTILFYIKRYIYRKIKVIYKSIHHHKMSVGEKQDLVDVKTDILDQVEKEVEQWAMTQAAEIEQLKAWQLYRRKFLGDISHELKTPIFNIQGYLETLLDGARKDPHVNKKYLKRAAKNVERLNTIVEDLQVIARLESGDLLLDSQPIDIRELADEVFEDLEIKAEKRNISLVFKQGADQHYLVNADRDYIRQVLMNLVLNSIKYGKDGGVTKVGFYDMDKNILVEVADDGIGIPVEYMKHVFDRFYRVDKSRSREQGGSGLGLAIVKHIVEAHNQTINVRSSEGIGSTFGFTLEKVN